MNLPSLVNSARPAGRPPSLALEEADQHAARQGVGRVRAGEAGFAADVLDHLDQLRLGRIAGHVDQEDAVGEQRQAPDVRAVVGEAEVVRLVALRAEVELCG